MTLSEKLFWALAAFILLACFMILAATANPAGATDCRTWPHSEWCDPPRKKVHRRKPKPEVRYYAPPRHEYEVEERFCLGPVRGVGTQWIGEQGALDAAIKDWRERTRYDYGEIFVDMTHAEDFRQRCGRTSIGEVAGQIFYRCEIWARPCKADFAEGEAPKK
jgi:hypothetical protein